MRITYICLENVAGIYVGMGLNKLEINFDKSKNKITCIQGPNGKGKSVLMGSLTPFSGVTSIDERSSLSYIIPGKTGYEEFHFVDGEDTYITKHYHRPSKGGDSHSVKSYFMKNGEELNENGNVSSFLELVRIHMGLTPDMLRLIRLGSNVSSFIKLTPAARKEYIGKLIDEIDVYLKIHKDVNDELRMVKRLMVSNNTNLYNCHISDPVVEEEKLSQLSKDIHTYEKERDKLVAKIGKIQSLMNDNNIDELKRKRTEAEASLLEFEKTERSVMELSLQDASVDDLIKQRTKLTDTRIEIQSKINSYRISIDQTRKNIERLELAVKKVVSNHDIEVMMSRVKELKEELEKVSPIIVDFHPECSADTVSYLISLLTSFNQIGKMFYTLGNKPVDVFLRLWVDEKKSVGKFIAEQSKKNMHATHKADIKSLMETIFQNDDIISPNCDEQFHDCPYYRLADAITHIHDQLEEESYDDETLRYINIIGKNLDSILHRLDANKNYIDMLPDKIKSEINEDTMYRHMRYRTTLFDLSDLQEYMGLVKDHELYMENVHKLKEYEQQIAMYKQSGVDNQLAEIRDLESNVAFYQRNIETLNKELNDVNSQLSDIDNHIGLVTKYTDGKKYKKIVEGTLESTNKVLAPLESASSEKMELEYELRNITNLINLSRENHKQLENKLKEYNRLLTEGKELSEKYNDLNIILEAVSTKKGIPVIYMKQYLGQIQTLANNLLRLIYDDELQLGRFNVTQDSFEVPYIKNGTKVPDVKYASQSEIALITMALSFALANRLSGNYNILLLDEIDAGLDETNRSAFLKMLNMQMNALKAEQVFIISHNLSQMINVPMDVIKFGEGGITSKLQNIIYE